MDIEDFPSKILPFRLWFSKYSSLTKQALSTPPTKMDGGGILLLDQVQKKFLKAGALAAGIPHSLIGELSQSLDQVCLVYLIS
jgi:hypothetical protein